MTPETQAPIVAALVAEHRRGESPLWQIVLIWAFEPMLYRLRFQMGTFNDEDLDQRLFTAFLASLASKHFSPDVPLASIHRATLNGLKSARRRERDVPDLSDDGEMNFGAPARQERDVALKLAIDDVTARPEIGEDVIESLPSTLTGEETVKEYVARTYPGVGEMTRRSTYERICRRQNTAVILLRARLGGDERAAA